MVQCNQRIRQYVPNFKLFLGFTGAMFLWGGDDADKGEKMMIGRDVTVIANFSYQILDQDWPFIILLSHNFE